jgi:hypothetical protein
MLNCAQEILGLGKTGVPGNYDTYISAYFCFLTKSAYRIEYGLIMFPVTEAHIAQHTLHKGGYRIAPHVWLVNPMGQLTDLSIFHYADCVDQQGRGIFYLLPPVINGMTYMNVLNQDGLNILGRVREDRLLTGSNGIDHPESADNNNTNNKNAYSSYVPVELQVRYIPDAAYINYALQNRMILIDQFEEVLELFNECDQPSRTRLKEYLRSRFADVKRALRKHVK